MRAWNKLSSNFVRGVVRDRRKGRFSDGGHLYLQAVNGGASWTFQFERNGRERSMGLGRPASCRSLWRASWRSSAASF